MYTVPETQNVPENLKPQRKPSYVVRRASLAAASSANVIFRAILAFVAITAALVLVGVTYTYFGSGHFDPRSIASWFLRLSPQQWIALGVGIAVALVMILIPCAKITGRKGTRDVDSPAPPRRRFVEWLGVVAVLALYVAGLASAYHVSLALGQSRDWAVIHSVYSWVYVGYSFTGWVGEHSKQPLGKTLRQFLVMMGM